MRIAQTAYRRRRAAREVHRAQLMLGKRILLGAVISGVLHAGCVFENAQPMSEDEPDPELVESSASALATTDPVSAAVAQSCTINAVRGLAIQLVEEIQCLRPNTMSRIDNVAGLKLGSTTFPYLQSAAAKALIDAQKARGVTMSINSGLRALPQQYLLYRWYQAGRCGIRLAAPPGMSNHESATAIDIQDNAAWRSALQSKSYKWLGANDPVHYDFIGGGTVDLRGLSVRAFQRLWNRNHPEDVIAEDGLYGPQTESRLVKSPSGGFSIGAKCDDAVKPMDPAMPVDEPVPTPDATEPVGESGAQPEERSSNGDGNLRARSSVDAGGCSVGSVRSKTGTSWLTLVGVGIALVATRRRRPIA